MLKRQPQSVRWPHGRAGRKRRLSALAAAGLVAALSGAANCGRGGAAALKTNQDYIEEVSRVPALDIALVIHPNCCQSSPD